MSKLSLHEQNVFSNIPLANAESVLHLRGELVEDAFLTEKGPAASEAYLWSEPTDATRGQEPLTRYNTFYSTTHSLA